MTSKLTRYAEADIPTAHGLFRLYVYRAGDATGPAPEEHVAMVMSRLDRDLIANSAMKRRLNGGEPKDGDKAGDQAKATGEGKKPFVDRQLDKAVSYLTDKLTSDGDKAQASK